MLKFIYEGINYVGFNAGEVLKAGQIVMADSKDGKNVVVSDGTAAIGVANVDVVAKGTEKDFRSALVRDTQVGEPIGVYLSGGVYETDQIVTGEGVTYKEGYPLYVTSEGLLTPDLDKTEGGAEPTETTGVLKVGEILEKKTSTVVYKLVI